MHAERCPVCGGRGELFTEFTRSFGNSFSTTTCEPTEFCKACSGRGWVEVRDREDMLNDLCNRKENTCFTKR